MIEDLELLTAEQWRTQSLCPEWNVQQMLPHLVVLTKQTPPKFFGNFVASGFRFDKMGASRRKSTHVTSYRVSDFGKGY